MNSRRTLGLMMAGMLAVGGGGFAIGAQLRSPADVRADAAPPERSPITAQVTRKALSSAVTTRGTIRFSDPKAVSLAGPVGSTSSAPPSAVVTRVVEKGTALNEGDVPVVIAGRPVFFLQGDLPMYRQITLGDSGDDVRQFEAALTRLGFDPGPADGVADAAFFTAVEAMYAAKGFEAQGLTDAQRDERRRLETAITTAEREVANARSSLATAGKPPTAAEIARADAAVQAAADAVNAARRRAEQDLATANADVAARQRALNNANADITAKQREVTDLQAAATVATTEVQRATQQRTTALALDPADPAAVQAADEALAAANTRLTEAQRAVRQAQSELDTLNRGLPQFQADLDAANRALAQVGPNSDEAMRAAQNGLTTAQAERRVLDAPRDVRAAQEQVDAAERSLTTARDDLARHQAENGTSLPAGEVVFVPQLPARVDDLKVKVGDIVNGPLMTLSSTTLAVDTSVATADRQFLREGAEVDVEALDFGIETTGKVTFVDTKPGTNGVDAQRVFVSVTLDDANLAEELAGASVRVTIPVGSTDGEVLTVPVTAIVTDPSGGTSVTVLRNGQQVEVKVRTGLAAGGDVEVTPIGGTLTEGDRVIIDEAASSQASAGTDEEAGAGGDAPEESTQDSTPGSTSGSTPASTPGSTVAP